MFFCIFLQIIATINYYHQSYTYLKCKIKTRLRSSYSYLYIQNLKNICYLRIFTMSNFCLAKMFLYITFSIYKFGEFTYFNHCRVQIDVQIDKNFILSGTLKVYNIFYVSTGIVSTSILKQGGNIKTQLTKDEGI